MMKYNKLRVIISGGGTGGHIFPALSIAGKLRELCPETEILFVGAEGKMEMEKVPAAGYKIVGLKVAGLQRQLTLKNIFANLALPFKVIGSIRKAGSIIDSFKPDVVVGVGGFASAPLLWSATHKGLPTLIQEQNGFAGLTNKILAKRVDKICVAYEGMERFFPADKIVFTGNPIRSVMHPFSAEDRAEGIKFYGLDPNKKHIFLTGGSLGCLTLNRSMREWIEKGCPEGEGIQVIWQCGKYYKAGIDEFMNGREHPDILYSDFISRMDLAYAVADVVISRSGASSVSELCAVRKASILVPSPNVAEDHQTHNAMALVSKGAALLVKDTEAPEKLLHTALNLVHDSAKIEEMEKALEPLARLDAANDIAKQIYNLL